jgi:hypothetical protein
MFGDQWSFVLFHPLLDLSAWPEAKTGRFDDKAIVRADGLNSKAGAAKKEPSRGG